MPLASVSNQRYDLLECQCGIEILIFLLQDEKRLREALLFANACGALTVQKKGAVPALPTKEAVDQFLHQTTD